MSATRRRERPSAAISAALVALSGISNAHAADSAVSSPAIVGAGPSFEIGRGATLTVGGQHRLRYQLLDPEDLGVARPRETTSVLLSRNLFHVDVRANDGLRAFGELGGFYSLGSNVRASPPDADDLDVTQLFIEARVEVKGLRIVVRSGRQEMALGSTRWVGTRDGTNVRQAFDLVRATVSGPSWSLDGFVGTTPALRRGVFDDSPAWQDGFWGVYGTVAVLPRKILGLDLFLLGRRRSEASYADGRGREVRHMVGTRAFGRTAHGLEYVAHGMIQTGASNGQAVLAWGLSAALWQRLPGPLDSVTIGLRSDALSGDTRPNDGKNGTFHPFFPNQTFFSALPAIYPTNLYELHPLVRVGFERVRLEGGCVFFWRQSLRDAVYRPPGAPLVVGPGRDARYTGAQASLSLVYEVDLRISFAAEYSHVFAGPGIVRGGGADVDFFGTWTTLTY